MKKVLFFVLIAVMMFTPRIVSAQHLKFEGIPIDGTISSFQSQLSAKGFKLNSVKSKEAPIGQRIFNGKLYGYNSEITVYYASKSKTVYKLEAEIHSEKKDVIQSILDKRLDKIEKTYIYKTEHDVEDATDMHFRFHIYPTKASENSIGKIEVHPTHTYYLTDDENNPLEFAGFAIEFTYTDKTNDGIVPQSEKEPHANSNFTCGDMDNFRKFSEWMLGYIQNGCYERAILYADWLLDYYRYDCIPYYVKNADGGDSKFDELIRSMQEKCVGTIPTGIGRERTNVYMVTDNETLRKFIEFEAKYYKGLLSNQIKIDEYDIPQILNTLEKLKVSFESKEKSIANQPLNKGWQEKVSVNLPALVGKEKSGTYGDVQWNRTNLLAYFDNYHDGALSLEITYEDDFQFVFRFRSVEQIEEMIQFFKSIDLN